jgi:hypothetical protein
MKKRLIGSALAIAVMALAVMLYTVHPLRASDHQDTYNLATRSNTSADITDVYIFPSPAHFDVYVVLPSEHGRAGHRRRTAAAGLRNDNISTVEVFLTNRRVRYSNGTLSDDHVVERAENLWAQSTLHAGRRLRFVGGVRADLYDFVVHDPDSANSGRTAEGIVSPKFLSAFEISRNQELYADFGDSFHSNDAREVFQTLDPRTHAPFDAGGAPVLQVTPLVRAVGEEIGYRYSNPQYTGTISLWQLNLNSELVFDGDHGTTFAGGPTVRRGFEVANFWKPVQWLTYDIDFSGSSARFLANFNGQGTSVPEFVNAVVSAGATIDRPSYAASLRLRYFGPRVLDQEGDAFSTPSLLLNLQYTLKLHGGNAIRVDVLNFLEARTDDVEYYYGSWLPQDARNSALAGSPAINPALGGGDVTDYHLHPTQQRTMRLSLVRHL